MQVDRAVIESADVVACLSGACLEHLPWTESYQKTFLDSRINTTRTLAEAIAGPSASRPSWPRTASPATATRVTGSSPRTAPSTRPPSWGRSPGGGRRRPRPAEQAGARVVHLRSGVVLGKGGGAFKPLSLLFRTGLGGPIADGDQYFSTISARDWVRAATYLAGNDDARGPYNVTGPMPLTNDEFTRTLARLLRRPTKLRVPAFVFKAAARPVASELLGSERVVPRRLEDEGFLFEHRTQEAILAAALGR